MDNFRIDVISEDREPFGLAVRLAMTDHSKVVAWKEIQKPDEDDEGEPTTVKGIAFLWTEDKEANRLPSPLEHEAAAALAWEWLQKAAYGDRPDFDGSVGKGFQVTNRDDEGSRFGYDYKIAFAVFPVWAMYGK